MAKVKKLLSLEALQEGNEMLDLGVPMTKVHKTLGLEGLWSYQSTLDIFKADRANLHQSTRPEWLKTTTPDGSMLVIPPPNHQYSGMFPWGEWVTKDAN